MSEKNKKEKPYYAHSVENQPESQWQTLSNHLSQVGEMAAGFAGFLVRRKPPAIPACCTIWANTRLNLLHAYAAENQTTTPPQARKLRSTAGVQRVS